MRSELSRFGKARYYGGIILAYILIVLFAATTLSPNLFRQSSNQPAVNPPSTAPPPVAPISGLPVRIVIPSLSLDLPVDKGFYDRANDSWTLSGYRAQFAMISLPANNQKGNTFVYGHNNPYVFGPLKSLNTDAEALIYTENGHVFHYNYQSTAAYNPHDTSIFRYQGPPILTIQTCTGSMNEIRQMYTFKFQRVGSA